MPSTPLLPALESLNTNKNSGPLPLTTIGENLDGQFSPDGKKILFLSRSRSSHSQTQAYEKDLTTGRERRVTFQDGDVSSPRYDSKGTQFYYASTTDELKENPLFLQQQLNPSATGANSQKPFWELMPTEIYSSGLFGDKIRRLTHARGFDGELSPHPKKPLLYFSAARGEHMRIFVLDLKTLQVRPFSSDSKYHELEVAVSPDGSQWAWAQYTDDLKSSQIVIANAKGERTLTLTSGSFLHVSPTWSAGGDRVIFAANADRADSFDLYDVRKDGTCLRRLTDSTASENHPSVSPDGRKLLYTATDHSISQLHVMPHDASGSSPPCLP